MSILSEVLSTLSPTAAIAYAYDVCDKYTCGNLNFGSLNITAFPTNTPEIITGNISCFGGVFENFINGPSIVHGDVFCTVRSLEGCPDIIHGKLYTGRFTDTHYREYIAKRNYMKQAICDSNDEAGLSELLAIL